MGLFLKGMVPELAGTPAIFYFHENQFAYPASAKQQQSVEPLMLNLYFALAADQVLFNTGYNQQTFLDGVEVLLKKLPGFVPKNVLDLFRNKLAALSVSLPEDVYLKSIEPAVNCLHIVFNHRYESCSNQPEKEALILADHLEKLAMMKCAGSWELAPDMKGLS